MRSLCCVISIIFAQIKHIFAQWQTSSLYLDAWNWRMVGGHYNDSIYLIGGSNDKKKVIRYQWTTQTFINVPNPLDTDIYGYGQSWTQHDHIIYMIVPETDDTMNQLATYNMRTNEFVSNFKQILTSVWKRACLASLYPQIYIVGGYNSVSDILNVVQILNVVTLQWQSDAPNMNQPREGLSCIVVDNYLWAFGGYGSGNYHTTNERIYTNNIVQNSWNYVDSLSIGVSALRCASWADVIYIIGGWDGRDMYDTVYTMQSQTGSILSIEHLPFVSFESTPIIVNGILHLFGGLDDAGRGVLEWLKFDLPAMPTSHPTDVPTTLPTAAPSSDPTKSPTALPTALPTAPPSDTPTNDPSIYPSFVPSKSPTSLPTAPPSDTYTPTLQPTKLPSLIPTSTTAPTSLPSISELVTTSRPTKSQLDAPRTEASIELILIITIGVLCIVIVCILVLWYVRDRHLRDAIKHDATQANIVRVSDEFVTTGNDLYNVNNAIATRKNTVEWLQKVVFVEDWLKEIGLPQYYEAFVANGYDSMPIVKEIVHKSELEAIGIVLSKHQQLILIEIKKLKAEGNKEILNGNSLTVGEISNENILQSEGCMNNDFVRKDSEGQKHETHIQTQTEYITAGEEYNNDEFIINDVQMLSKPQNTLAFIE